MKIGITTFGCDNGKSGIGRYIVQLLREFEKLESNHEFEAFVYQNEKYVFLKNARRIQPIPLKSNIRNPLINLAWHQTGLPNWCVRRKYNALFLPAANRRVPILAPCPMVGTVHDFSSIHVQQKYDPMRMFYIKHVLPFLVRRLTRVITVSESSKRDIVEYARVPEEKVKVIPLGVDTRTYFPRNRAISCVTSYKYGIYLPYILYVSRIEHPGKNHVRLIKAFEQLKEKKRVPHQLVLAGMDSARAEEVHRTAAQCRYSKDILFTGFVPDNDLADLYCAADMSIFPSLYEGFGLPVLEAMACKTPVACSNTSSLPEVAGDGALLFDPYDEESIMDAMDNLLEKTDLRNSFIHRGWEQSKKFSWEMTATKTLAVLSAVANRN